MWGQHQAFGAPASLLRTPLWVVFLLLRPGSSDPAPACFQPQWVTEMLRDCTPIPHPHPRTPAGKLGLFIVIQLHSLVLTMSQGLCLASTYSSLPAERIVSGGEEHDPFYRWSIQGHPFPSGAVLAILELKGSQVPDRRRGEFPASWLRWEWGKAFSGLFDI